MGVSRVLGVLKRRWYVAIIGLLFSAGLGVLGVWISPPAYLAQGTVLVLPSREQLTTNVRNPFLHLDGLTGPAGIVIVRLDSDQNRAAIEAVSPTAEYVVEPDPAMRGPGILVSVTDRTERGALDTLDFVLVRISSTLREVQAERNVPAAAVVGSMRLVVDTEPERETSGTVRMVVAGVGGGLVLTAIAMVALDVLLLRRAARRAATSPKAAGGVARGKGERRPVLRSPASRKVPVTARRTIRPRRLVKVLSRAPLSAPHGRRDRSADQAHGPDYAQIPSGKGSS